MKRCILIIVAASLVSTGCSPSKKGYGCPANPNPESRTLFIKRGLGK